jgi:hypothetical protein
MNYGSQMQRTTAVLVCERRKQNYCNRYNNAQNSKNSWHSPEDSRPAASKPNTINAAAPTGKNSRLPGDITTTSNIQGIYVTTAGNR